MLVTKLVRSVLCVVVLLSISAIGAGPAEGEGVTTEEDTSVSITLIGSDPDGDLLTYNVVTGPSHGRLSGTAPKLTYTPQPNFNGSDSFTFNVNDGTMDGVPVTVLIMVKAVNDPPTAIDGSVTTQEDTLVSITLAGCDPDGDALSYSVVKDPSHGSLSGTAPNLTYTPNANFNGSDSFLFNVNDGTVDSAAATVSIKLKPVNDPPTASYVGAKVQKNPPVAKDDSVTTKEDTPVSITLAGSDPDEDALSYTVVTCPSHGSLSGTAPNVSYTPKPNFNGSDSFTFKVSDEMADSDAATVSITVTAANDPPSANDDSARTQEDTPIAAIDVLRNDTDVDDDQLTTSAVTQGKNGSVTINADNTLSYSPKANFCGTDSFTYTVCDGKDGTDTATVNVKVKAVNDAPTAKDDSVTTQEDKSVSIRLSGNDPDGDSLSYHVVKGPSHGKLSGTAPKLRYSPNANFNGSDSFTFKVSDKTTDSAAATVSIKVKPVNDTPTANDDSVTTQEERPVSIRLSGNDPDGDSLSYSVVKGPSHGKLSGKGPKLRYSPNANFNGSDSFAFKVSDKTTDSAAATVSITVKAVNNRPTAKDDSAMTQEDKPVLAINVLTNDTDVDNDQLNITTVTQGTNGSVSINTDNTLSYSPKANFCGNDSFTYTVSDGKGGTDTATVNVKVKAVNDAPSFTSTPITTATVDALYTYDVDATDPDAGDTLAYSLTIKPKGMTIDTATGLIQWTPTSEQAGANDVVVKVADNRSVPASEIQSFTITAALLSTPVTTALTIADDSEQKVKKILLLADKSDVVQISDDSRGEIDSGLYTSYDFSDISIPTGAEIASVVVYVEHFEQEGFPDGKLQWAAGTGWPSKPVVWTSINAPV
ncbi:MAG: Ig-like domain-containing protein, partial [candidate division Zixibacteria bacterium]